MNTTLRVQKNIAFLAVALFFIKIAAWWFTQSVAIFTDALESVINIATGFIGWYSVWLSAKPRDRNHPYGHGKIEFVSAAIEGTLISIAGIVIIIEAVRSIQNPITIRHLDRGLILLGATALLNGAAGFWAIHHGKVKRSATVEAAGRHLTTDTYSTAGVIVGLIVLKITHWLWLDVAIALAIACVVLYNGYKVLRSSLAGIMDEADMTLLTKLVAYLNENRRPQWIDLHNLRVIQYGSILHLDGHLTLPWYYNVREAHEEISALNRLIQQRFGGSVELFVHVDNCEDFSCNICELFDCPVRQHPYRQRIEWTVDNVLRNEKHYIGGGEG